MAELLLQDVAIFPVETDETTGRALKITRIAETWAAPESAAGGKS